MENGIKQENFFKKYQKVLIPVVIVLALLLVVILLLTTGKKEVSVKEGEKVTAITEKGIIKDEEYKNLKFSNATLIKENGIYTLSIDVQNTSKETINVDAVNIPIKDKNGNEIIALLGYIGKELKPDEVTTITASTSADLSKAYTKEITEKK